MRREFSAGGVVFRDDGGVTRWLVRRPTESADYRGNLGWSLPKGWIDDTNDGKSPGALASGERKASEEEIRQAAVREVREEGGIEAEIVDKIDTLKFFFVDSQKEKVMKFVTYYLMRYGKDIPSGWGWETAEAKWLAAEEAEKMLAYKSERNILEKAASLKS